MRIPKMADVLAGKMEFVVGLPWRPLKVASVLGFLWPNAKISVRSAKPSAQRGTRFRRPSKSAKSTVFRILIETNMNSNSTQSTKNGIGPDQVYPSFLQNLIGHIRNWDSLAKKSAFPICRDLWYIPVKGAWYQSSQDLSNSATRSSCLRY